MQITDDAAYPAPDYFEAAFGAREDPPAVETRTLIAFSDGVTGLYTELTGTGFNLSNGNGTVTGFSTWTAEGGALTLTAGGFAWGLGDFLAAVDAYIAGTDAPLAALFDLQPITYDASGAANGVHFAPLITGSRLDITGSGFGDRLTGGSSGDTLRGLDGADFLEGGAGADVLRGGMGADLLDGGAGADTLSGGQGRDTAGYLEAGRGVTADLAAGTATGQGNDRLDGIENLLGSAHGDALSGDGGGNRLEGVSGSDTLDGRGGDDTLEGGSGDDRLAGGAEDDLIRGGTGFDSLDGGAGRDTLNGGAGYDMVLYADAARGVTVDLAAGTATGQGADTLRRIEDVTGSGFGDAITGDGGDNIVNGLDGGDRLAGRASADTLNGGDGADVIRGGTGRDVLSGDRGADVLSGGQAADRLSGGDGRDRLTGGTGDDTVSGGGGADSFVFRGHIDADTVTDYLKGTDRLALDAALWGGGLSARQVVTTHASDLGADILFDFGGGETILLEGVGSRAGLYLDIDIL